MHRSPTLSTVLVLSCYGHGSGKQAFTHVRTDQKLYFVVASSRFLQFSTRRCRDPRLLLPELNRVWYGQPIPQSMRHQSLILAQTDRSIQLSFVLLSLVSCFSA